MNAELNNVRVSYSPFRRAFEVYAGVIQDNFGGRRVAWVNVPEPLFDEPPEQAVACSPSFTITEGAAQALIDDLWNAGLRPANCKHTSETIDAMKAHLADTRENSARLFRLVDMALTTTVTATPKHPAITSDSERGQR